MCACACVRVGVVRRKGCYVLSRLPPLLQVYPRSTLHCACADSPGQHQSGTLSTTCETKGMQMSRIHWAAKVRAHVHQTCLCVPARLHMCAQATLRLFCHCRVAFPAACLRFSLEPGKLPCFRWTYGTLGTKQLKSAFFPLPS